MNDSTKDILESLKIVLTKDEKGKILNKFNPYNPLTYLIILTVFIFEVVSESIKVGKEVISDAIEAFKWR